MGNGVRPCGDSPPEALAAAYGVKISVGTGLIGARDGSGGLLFGAHNVNVRVGQRHRDRRAPREVKVIIELLSGGVKPDMALVHIRARGAPDHLGELHGRVGGVADVGDHRCEGSAGLMLEPSGVVERSDQHGHSPAVLHLHLDEMIAHSNDVKVYQGRRKSIL